MTENQENNLSFIPQDEIAHVCRAMCKSGGGFVSRLGEALKHADPDNTRRIKEAFPEYWNAYKKEYEENPELYP